MTRGYFDLDGAVALVTGGAGLIGEAVSEALVHHGATVVIADTAVEAGETLADSLDPDARFEEADVTADREVRRLVERTLEEDGSIDVLVNCAYPANENYGQGLDTVSVEDWRDNVDRHLAGHFVPSYHVSRAMREHADGGSIVNFGSIYGVQAPDFTVYDGTELTSPAEYATAKGGIINMTRHLASQLGEYDIRVNAISPGGIFDGQDERFVRQYESRTPLDRMATPSDLQGAVVFLASDASRYVTGHNLVVDGGWTIQ